MRTVLVLASVMLSMTAFAEITPPGNDDLCTQNPGNPHCHDDGGNGGGGGEGGNGSSVVDIVNTNTNTLDNTNTNDIDFNFGGGEEGAGSFNNTNDVDNTSTATVGDTTATGGNVYIGGGYGEEGEGGDTLSPTATSDSSTTIGDTTLNNDSTSVSGANASTGDQITNVDNTDNSFDGGNTLIIGGGGECYEGECEGGSGTLNSNADANATGGNATIEEGANTNNNTATGGSVESGAVVVENNITVEGGSDVPTANSQTVEGDETEINVDARTINEASTVKPAVSSVAPSFSGICNSGAAGQSRGFALSLAVTNDVCQALMMADAYMALGDVEEARKWVEAAARHAGWKGGLGYVRHLVTLGIL